MSSQFRCACGSQYAGRVTVERPGKPTYETPFAYCYHCRAMYHWPGALPAAKWNPSYGAMPAGDQVTADPEVAKQIEEAAARARHRRKRH